MKVILISGKKRSGKNFLANILKEYYEKQGFSVKIDAFGDILKDIICASFKITHSELEEYKNNKNEIYVQLSQFEKPKTTVTFKQLLNFRELLQNFATEGMRTYFGEDVWVNAFLNKNKKLDVDYLIVSDWRFKVEDLSLRGYSTLKVRVKGMFDKIADTHRSETELDNYEFDVKIDNHEHPSKENLLRQYLRYIEEI